MKYTHSRFQNENPNHNIQYKPSVLYLNETILEYKPQPIITQTQANNLDAYSLFKLKNSGLQTAFASLSNYELNKTKSIEPALKSHESVVNPKPSNPKKIKQNIPTIMRETTLIYNLAKTRLQVNRNIKSRSPIIGLRKKTLIDDKFLNNIDSALNSNIATNDYSYNMKPFLKLSNNILNFSI